MVLGTLDLETCSPCNEFSPSKLTIKKLMIGHFYLNAKFISSRDQELAGKMRDPGNEAGSYRGNLWHGSRTQKIANYGSWISKFYFPESRKYFHGS